MGKIRKLPKQRDKSNTFTIKDRSLGTVSSDVTSERSTKTKGSLIKQLTKLKVKPLKATARATAVASDKPKIKKKSKNVVQALSNDFQAMLAPSDVNSEPVSSQTAHIVPPKNQISQRAKELKMKQQKETRCEVKAGESIPLAVVMPDCILPGDIKSSVSDDDELLRTKSSHIEEIELCNKAESDISTPYTPSLQNEFDSNVPLMVSMMDRPVSSPVAEAGGPRNVCQDKDNSEIISSSPAESVSALNNVGTSVSSKCKVNESNKSMKRGRDPHDVSTNASLESFSNSTVHLIGDSVVLQLCQKQLYITGQVHIQVLRGRIKILGYEMNCKSGSHIVSSLRGSSFLSIQPLPSTEDEWNEDVLPSEVQERYGIHSLLSQSKPNEVWILLRKGDQAFWDFLQKYLDYPIYVKNIKPCDSVSHYQAQNKLKCVFHPDNNLGQRVFESAEWNDLAAKVIEEQNGCTVLCGGKGVGKSTLLRYLVNRLLSERAQSQTGVVVLDFDPGQAEVTPPGCVALSVIRQPLLGPNYTHLQSSERCIYIGQVDVSQCLGHYMEACSSLVSYLRESSHLVNLPCLVNTMGFTKGIGVTIMGQLVQLLKPTRLVQIQSKRPSNNYPFLLTGSQVIRNSRSLDARSIRNNLQSFALRKKNELNLTYDYVPIKSVAERGNSKNQNEWGMRPKMCRDAVVLSYFYGLCPATSCSFLDDVPYACSLGSLFVCVAHEQVPPDLILAAMNGCMVGLISIDPMTENVLYSSEPGMPGVIVRVPVAPCRGFGIVRGVDIPSKTVYVTTPLREDLLATVNCLILGAINLPTSVYTKMTAPGTVPYVSAGEHPGISTPTSIGHELNVA